MEVELKRSQLYKAAKLWMDNNYEPNKLDKVENPKYPNSIFYKKNGKVVMEVDMMKYPRNKEFFNPLGRRVF